MLWIAATLAAYYVKGLCGFANTLVFTTMLSYGVSNAGISPVELLLSYPTNLAMTWKNRKFLLPRVYIPLSLLVLAGSVPGALLLKNVDAGMVKIIFGAAVVFIGLEMLLDEYRKGAKRRLPPVLLGVIGIAAGLLCGLFGVGALLAAYVSRTTDTNDAFKANINIVFSVEGTFRMAMYLALGLFDLAALRQAALLLPFAALGLLLGVKSARRLNERLVKRLVIVLLILSGASLILKSL